MKTSNLPAAAVAALLITGCGASTPSPQNASAALALNRELGRAFVEDLENAKSQEQFSATLDRLISPRYIQHNPLVPPGKEGLAKFTQSLGLSFRDARATLCDTFATTDRVVARWTFTGTLTGEPFLGVPASGQKLEFDILDEWTIDDGKLYEHWDRIDWTRAVVQLGVKGLPQPFVDVAVAPSSRGANPPVPSTALAPEVAAANKELGRAFVEELENAKSPDAFSRALTKVVSPRYIQHNPIVPPGREGLAKFLPALAESFPDGAATLREAFATSDRVFARWTFTGTLSGKPFFGIAATGQKVEFDIMDIWTVDAGQLYEHWDQIDWTRALGQLGVATLPKPFLDEAARPANR